MKFSYDFRVDNHDTDINGIASASAVMRYIQETANLQHVCHGPTMEELRNDGKAFILSRAALDIRKPLYSQDKITVTSWLCEAKGFGFFRNTEIRRGGDEIAAMSAFWGAMDINTRRPIRAEEIKLGFGTTNEPITVSAPLRFRPSRDTEYKELGQYRVSYGDCDQNIHLNNTNYPRIFCGFFSTMSGKRVSEFSINYLHEARLGASFKVFGAEYEGATLIKTELEDGTQGSEARIVLTDI